MTPAEQASLSSAMEPAADNCQTSLAQSFGPGQINPAKAYVAGLKQAYLNHQAREEWDHFQAIVHGASQADLDRLREAYPDVPDSLVELLKLVDGTYWREYQGEKIAFYFLGSDLEEYPYYLLSAKQMLETGNEAREFMDYLITREYGDPVDEEITNDLDGLCWLHFSDCMNNGGTSQLFIDFSPSETGKKGQIIRYVHDPDGLSVIADSFDEYLQMLMEQKYDFINEDDF